MSLLLIDNYDSFTYNIVELLRTIGIYDITILKNDIVDTTTAMNFDKIIISPGPELPKDAGNILSIIQDTAPTKSILGICLGHQAIVQAFGGSLKNYATPQHGSRKSIRHNGTDRLFDHIPTTTQVGLYHSWFADNTTLPNALSIIATDHDNIIMAVRHNQYATVGIQFHPESYMTDFGALLVKNWYEKG